VRIGRHALIGMGSAVLHDVPARTVVVGSPARAIRRSY
jgi:acetyltransferase-like isoleucine patch superfamily enzyme